MKRDASKYKNRSKWMTWFENLSDLNFMSCTDADLTYASTTKYKYLTEYIKY